MQRRDAKISGRYRAGNRYLRDDGG